MLTFVQPLLRSFRIDGTRAQLQITQLNQQISEIALRATIVRTVAARAQRVLGSHLRDRSGGSGRRVARAGTKLVQDNQRTRRSGHAGAARRRPGAGRRSDPAPGCGPDVRGAAARRSCRSSGSSSAARTIRTGAPRSIRWTGPPTRLSRSTLARPCRKRSTNRTDLEQARRQIAGQRSCRCEACTTSSCRRSTSRPRYGVGGRRRDRSSSARASAATSSGTIPSGYSRRVADSRPIRTRRPGTSR